MDKNISHIIDECCKKEGIKYSSINPNYIEFTTDVQELIQIDIDLKTIIDKLRIIEERHEVDGLAAPLEKAIQEIGCIDHLITKVARKIKNV
jgi:hypothetical protein